MKGAISLKMVNCNIDFAYIKNHIDKERTAIIIGNIPMLTNKKFASLTEEHSAKLTKSIKECFDNGYDTFLIGCYNILDILAGESLLQVKQSNPGLTFIAAKIFNDCEYVYCKTLKQIKRLQTVASQADYSFDVFDKYRFGIEKEQLHFLCENCTYAITLYEKKNIYFNEIKKLVREVENIFGLSQEVIYGR